MQARDRLAILLLSSVMPLSFSTVASAAGNPSADQVLINVKNIKWSAAPPAVPKGAQVAVLHGDPNKEGEYVMRVKLPPRYKMPFHWHTKTEHITVISGALYVANQETFDKRIAHPVKQGGFLYLPARAQQFAFTKGATVVEIHGEGPYDIKYTNPSDDPQMGTPGKPYYFPKEFEGNELSAPEGSEPTPTF
jgi:quercetin dioxygenase-like cupin family protein